MIATSLFRAAARSLRGSGAAATAPSPAPRRPQPRAAAAAASGAGLMLTALMLAEPVAPSRSILDGVYSADQIARGKKGYDSLCARCHGEALGGGEDSPALVTEDFLRD